MRGAMAGMLRRSRRSAERGLAVAVLALVHIEPRDLVGDRPVSGSGGARRGWRRARRVTLLACLGAASAPRRAAEAANRKPAGHHDHARRGLPIRRLIMLMIAVGLAAPAAASAMTSSQAEKAVANKLAEVYGTRGSTTRRRGRALSAFGRRTTIRRTSVSARPSSNTPASGDWQMPQSAAARSRYTRTPLGSSLAWQLDQLHTGAQLDHHRSVVSHDGSCYAAPTRSRTRARRTPRNPSTPRADDR